MLRMSLSDEHMISHTAESIETGVTTATWISSYRTPLESNHGRVTRLLAHTVTAMYLRGHGIKLSTASVSLSRTHTHTGPVMHCNLWRIFVLYVSTVTCQCPSNTVAAECDALRGLKMISQQPNMKNLVSVCLLLCPPIGSKLKDLNYRVGGHDILWMDGCCWPWGSSDFYLFFCLFVQDHHDWWVWVFNEMIYILLLIAIGWMSIPLSTGMSPNESWLLIYCTTTNSSQFSLYS